MSINCVIKQVLQLLAKGPKHVLHEELQSLQELSVSKNLPSMQVRQFWAESPLHVAHERSHTV